MLLLILAVQLLVLAQASFPDAGNAQLVNSSDPHHHRSKRAVFVTTPNCPEPIYLTQAQVSAWPGITVDTAQKTILNEERRLNLFNCSEDTFFVYTHLPTVLTRADWWLACGPTMKNGWRVGKKGSSGDSTYGMIPVGCVKPTCTGLSLFEGNESVFTKYHTYQIVPNKPSLIGINQKFQFTCPLGSSLGFAASETTITLDATMKITCEAEGWWKRTSSNLAGELLSTKVACFKLLDTPPPLPTTCTGPAVNFFNGSEPIIAANAAVYQLINTVPSIVDGKKVIVCPTGSALGYAIGDKKLSIEPELKVTCESAGWWVTANWWRSGAALNSLKIGCFKELLTSLPAAPVSAVPKTACGCWYERSTCRTCDSEKLFVLEGQGENNGKCTLGCANGYMFEGGDVNMISCMSEGWIGSSRTDTNVTVPYSGAFGYITASCVPAPTPGKCPLSYSTFECEGCDKSKIIGLSSPKSSLGCVLACDKDYRLLVQTSPTNVIRAQEAVAEPGLFNVYKLGDVKTPIKVVWNNKDKYSCEPVTADPAVPVKVIDMGKCAFPKKPDGPYAIDFLLSINAYGNIEFKCPDGHGVWGNFGADGPLLMEQSDGFNCDPSIGKLMSRQTKTETLFTTAVCRPVITDGCLSKISSDAVMVANGHVGLKCAPGFQTKNGAQEISSMRCASGVLTATYSDGKEAVLPFPATNIDCIPTTPKCSDPVWMTDATIASSSKRFTVDTTQQATRTEDGQSVFSCKPDSFIGYWTKSTQKLDYWSTPGQQIRCNPAVGNWTINNKSDVEMESVGCITASCAPLNLLDGTESALTSSATKYELVQNKPSLYSGKWYFYFICPTGSKLAQLVGDSLVFSTDSVEFQCNDGWKKVVNDATPVPLPAAEKYGCVVATTPAVTTPPPVDPSRIPPDSEKRRCGCPYDFSGCPTCEWKQMFRIDGFGDASGYCTLGCGKGYMFEGGQVNMLSCKKGQGWFGSPRLVPNGPAIPMGSGDKITTSCVPVPSAGTCSVQYSTFTCEKNQCAYHKSIVALSSPRSTCVLSCDNGYRLLVLNFDKVIRAQEAVLEEGKFKVYPLGDSQNAISIATNIIKFSCEAALLTQNELIPIFV